MLRNLIGIDPGSLDQQPYPPYNVLEDGDGFRVEVAVRGFAKGDLSVTVAGSCLSVSGNLSGPPGLAAMRGMAGRDFALRFEMDEGMQVDSADLDGELLVVALSRATAEQVTIPIGGARQTLME